MSPSSAVTGLIGLLDTFALSTATAIRQRVVDTAAEHYEAEVAAIVAADGIRESTGLGGTAELSAAVAALAGTIQPGGGPTSPAAGTIAEVPGLGPVHVASLPIDAEEARFVLMRTAGPFSAEELRGGRAMVRIMRLATGYLGAFDEQVRISRELAREVELNRTLAGELQHRHTELMGRMLAIQGMLTNSSAPVLETIVQQAEALVPGAIVMLQLQRDDGMLELRLASAAAPAAYRECLRLVPAGRGLAGAAMARNELVLTDDYGSHENAHPGLVAAGLTATMSAPVRRRSEVVGALSLSSLEPGRRFTRDEVETTLLLAGYASVALTDALTLDQRQQALEEAEWQATHDPLTGLANRRLVMDTLTERLRSGRDLVVLYIDVDRFKSVNDRYGHHVGDQLIREVAARIDASTRADDLVGRLAGDEFIVVFGSEIDLEQADRIAERIRQSLNGPATVGGRTVPLSVSIGIATSDGVVDADDVINAADVAMYQAKSGGRNQVGRYNRGFQTRLRHQAELAERLEIAMAVGEGFHIEYQPVVEIATGAVVGHEALLRWEDPVLGRVPPDTFIPVAEELGLVARIDDWVLTTAMAETMAAGGGGRLSVNVSPPWLARSRVAEAVAAVAAAHRFPLASLALEVTERVAVADNVTDTLAALRSLGVRILLDDFGTGYSSLAYVRTLDIDGIKIDRGFLQGVDSDRHTAAILEAVVTLTDRLGSSAIAEGVETGAQAQLLLDLGCRLAQGYWYGRPRPAPGGILPYGTRLPGRATPTATDPVRLTGSGAAPRP